MLQDVDNGSLLDAQQDKDTQQDTQQGKHRDVEANTKTSDNDQSTSSFSISFTNLSQDIYAQTREVLDKISLVPKWDLPDLPDTTSVMDSLDPYGLFRAENAVGNTCQAMTDVPNEIKMYYNNLSRNNDTFTEQDGATLEDSRQGASTVSQQRHHLKPQRSVTFGHCHVREYNRTVGDHPDVSNGGPPLTIDWDYVQHSDTPLDWYEGQKQRRRQRRMEKLMQSLKPNQSLPHIPNIEMTVPRIKGKMRRQLLASEFHVSEEELDKAEEDARRVARLREESCSKSVFSEKTEELIQLAQRRLRRLRRFVGKQKLKSSGDNSDEQIHRPSERCKSNATFANSLYLEALRRETEKNSPSSKRAYTMNSSARMAAAGPEPDGSGGWKKTAPEPRFLPLEVKPKQRKKKVEKERTQVQQQEQRDPVNSVNEAFEKMRTCPLSSSFYGGTRSESGAELDAEPSFPTMVPVNSYD